ncbi:MAG: hypothetical protein AAFU53_06530 [Cyanobacteria bacterium J06632_3]
MGQPSQTITDIAAATPTPPIDAIELTNPQLTTPLPQSATHPTQLSTNALPPLPAPGDIPIGKFQSIEAGFAIEFLPGNQAILKGNGVDHEVMNFQLLEDQVIRFTDGLLQRKIVPFQRQGNLLIMSLEGETLILETVEEFTIKQFWTQADKALPYESRQYVSVLSRAQHAFYIEAGRFSENLEALGLFPEAVNAITSNHVNTLRVFGSTGQVGVAGSQPNKAGLSSAIALFKKDPTAPQQLIALFCDGHIPPGQLSNIVESQGQYLLANPNASLSCPAGMQRFS